MFNDVSKLVCFNNHICFDWSHVNTIHDDTSVQKKKLTVMSLCSQEIKEKGIVNIRMYLCVVLMKYRQSFDLSDVIILKRKTMVFPSTTEIAS